MFKLSDYMLKDKLNENHINHTINEVNDNGDTQLTKWFKIGVCVFIYLIIGVILRQIALSRNPIIVINDIVFNIHNFSGILAQVRVMISVYLTVKFSKKGYFIALLLNIHGLLSSIWGAFFRGGTNAFPGIIVGISVIIIIKIINNFEQSLNIRMKEVRKQKEELGLLYEEVSISKEKLYQQNQRLVEYNQILKKNEEELEHLAFYDILTGIPNRKMIIERLEQLTSISSKQEISFAVVFIDLDNFKKINDSMGHHVGDGILQLSVERWAEKIHKNDMLGRLGGDEFALIIQRELKREAILSYVESLRIALQEALVFECKKFHVSASFGISIYPKDGDNPVELLRAADIAMYKVKNHGKNGIQFFSQDMQGEILQKVKIESEMRSAIKNNELYLVFQPQYSSDSKSLRGFEALARWQSSELGFISPAEFIPVMEETGFIVVIGNWILKDALRKFKTIHDTYNIYPILSINISITQIIEPHFLKVVQEALDDTGFESNYLEFEITESVFISFPDYVIEVLNKLKEIGIRIALDDFGAGYTSLKYLQMFPIDTLKIDKIFIDSIDLRNTSNQILGSIILLAHQLGIEVVAEGIENTTQLDYLTEQKCDYIQGYLLGKPVNYDQMIELLS